MSNKETLPWFETHAHLSDAQFDGDRDDVIERAFENGIQSIVEIADGPTEWPKAQALAERYPKQMWWTAGLHPYYADQATENNLNVLREATKHPQCVAVGEIGLDYFKCQIPHDTQIETLSKTIEIALEANKPVVIHCREAYADLHPILKRYFSTPSSTCPGVIHCFSGNKDDADALLKLGFFLGVDGPLTYPSAQSLRDVIQSVPIERLVLETDSPYLPPQGYRGKRNEPAYLPLIGDALVKMLPLSKQELTARLSRNFHTLFRLNTSSFQ